MNLQTEIQRIKKELDKVDDVRIIEMIKNLLAYARSKEGFELTDAHRSILEERKARYGKGAGKSSAWEEVKQQARSRH